VPRQKSAARNQVAELRFLFFHGLEAWKPKNPLPAENRLTAAAPLGRHAGLWNGFLSVRIVCLT
jgi:hypothetical protein